MPVEGVYGEKRRRPNGYTGPSPQELLGEDPEEFIRKGQEAGRAEAYRRAKQRDAELLRQADEARAYDPGRAFQEYLGGRRMTGDVQVAPRETWRPLTAAEQQQVAAAQAVDRGSTQTMAANQSQAEAARRAQLGQFLGAPRSELQGEDLVTRRGDFGSIERYLKGEPVEPGYLTMIEETRSVSPEAIARRLAGQLAPTQEQKLLGYQISQEMRQQLGLEAAQREKVEQGRKKLGLEERQQQILETESKAQQDPARIYSEALTKFAQSGLPLPQAQEAAEALTTRAIELQRQAAQERQERIGKVTGKAPVEAAVEAGPKPAAKVASEVGKLANVKQTKEGAKPQKPVGQFLFELNQQMPPGYIQANWPAIDEYGKKTYGAAWDEAKGTRTAQIGGIPFIQRGGEGVLGGAGLAGAVSGAAGRALEIPFVQTAMRRVPLLGRAAAWAAPTAGWALRGTAPFLAALGAVPQAIGGVTRAARGAIQGLTPEEQGLIMLDNYLRSQGQGAGSSYLRNLGL